MKEMALLASVHVYGVCIHNHSLHCDVFFEGER